jgi:Mycothiol maleylpyruvate isomerase N-terminal domain
MQAVEPVIVVDLFPQERRLLLELFAELADEDWQMPTVCAGWTVRDIGLHLLGDDIGYLSGRRDSFSNPFFEDRDMERWESLVQNINEANELWVRATRRISPALLSALLELTGRQFYEYVSSLDQIAMNGAVSWAGRLARVAGHCQGVYGTVAAPAADTRRSE